MMDESMVKLRLILGAVIIVMFLLILLAAAYRQAHPFG